ncbi:MAG TPA: siderophore-interacting protein [Solirubrobacteraceae bacterium]|nr:siderophore-interacting protein [Solirubrobacteraceae bacterium]
MSRAFPLHTGIATVTARRPVTEAMLCLTLNAPAFANLGVEQPGEVITLGWPLDGERLVLPEAGWRFSGGRREQHWRNFTVRRHDPSQATVDIDFFRHGVAGRGIEWAAHADAGDRVGFAGPRAHWRPDPEARWWLLVADETALPALLAILESAPAGLPVIAVAEIGNESERQAVDSVADVRLHWAARHDRPPGTTTVLRDTLRRIDLPRQPGQAWGGGEALAMRDIRDHLRAGRPLLAASTDIRGYWKRDEPDDVG